MGAAESREFTRRELLLLYSLLQAHQDNLTALGKPLPKQSKTAQDASGKLWEALTTTADSFLLTGVKRGA